MSLNRYDRRRDDAERPIIDALEGAGWLVEQLDRPVDLLCWKAGTVKLLEVKTGRGKNLRIVKDKRQKAQIDFLMLTRTPIVRTPEEALRAVGAIAPHIPKCKPDYPYHLCQVCYPGL